MGGPWEGEVEVEVGGVDLVGNGEMDAASERVAEEPEG